MIGMMLRMAGAPVQMLLCGACAAAICGCLTCFSCRRCKCRDLACVKWFFRTTGHDTYDEFELLVQVHEVSFESRKPAKTVVRLTAGQQIVSTAKSKKGFFQEVLSILIEQGTTNLVVDLLTDGGALLANLKLDIVKDVIASTDASASSQVYHMNQKERGVLNPTVTLTLSAGADSGGLDDIESGLLDGEDQETAFLMRKHLATVHQDVMAETGKNSKVMHDSLRSVMVDASEADVEMLEVLVRACCGPIEVFQGFGTAQKRYFGVVGPPISRRFVLGTWKEQKDMETGKPSEKEVDFMKIQSVQADPTRTDVFHLSFIDSQHLTKKITCRIVDRPTKVWVETMTLLITRLRAVHSDHKKERKKEKESTVRSSGKAPSSKDKLSSKKK